MDPGVNIHSNLSISGSDRVDLQVLHDPERRSRRSARGVLLDSGVTEHRLKTRPDETRDGASHALDDLPTGIPIESWWTWDVLRMVLISVAYSALFFAMAARRVRKKDFAL